MTIKSKILTGLIALSLAAPLAMATPAAAAPRHDDSMRGGHAMDVYHDHSRHPPLRVEHRPPMPRHGHYHWRDGSWQWRGGVWVWLPGLWVRF